MEQAMTPDAPARRFTEAECVEPGGHLWQTLTRHPDPPGHEGVLPNAICVHCSEMTVLDLSDPEPRP
jgi:hypothetical protein